MRLQKTTNNRELLCCRNKLGHLLGNGRGSYDPASQFSFMDRHSMKAPSLALAVTITLLVMLQWVILGLAFWKVIDLIK